MGNFYVNYTIRETDRDKVAKAFQGRNAILTPEKNGCIVAADEASDEQDQAEISELAKNISNACKCAVLAVLNHDDDVLWYQLYEKGKLADEYDSSPNYFSDSDEQDEDEEDEDEMDDSDEEEEEDEDSDEDEPKGGNAKRLCAAFEAENPSEVDDVLHTSEYTFAVERHQALVEALGISDYAIGFGYEYADAGELPGELTKADLLRISS